ncbi:MAG: response regulator, partial [Gammaproteobacteria bacterium]|nr:response regulator [Gammaproteobacteria bacterium]
MSPTDQMVKTKVLIIEDEALVARELQIRLTKLDYNVVGVAASAVEAINLSSEHEPDLLLADIHIKGDMDGIEATRRIRDTRDVPVVFLTAYSDAETVARAKEVTPYGYIIKPVENRELEVAIEIALYKSRVERELKETRELLAMALQCVGDALLFMDINGTVTQISHEMQDLLKVSLPDIKGKPWHDAMGITEGSGVSQLVTQAITSRSLVRLSPFVLTDSAKNQYLVDGVVGPRDKGMVVILRCVTEINDEIQALTGPSSELPAFVPGTASFVQLVISIADVERKTLPAEVVGEILDEVENTVNQTLRSTDLASRYGKHLLVASLPYTALSEGEAIAGSLLKALQSRNYLAGRQSCRFSIGLAHGVQGDADPFELLRRATLAMDIARESGDERVHTWRPDPERHNDIFRSGDDTGSNYRHIVLLWNVMNALGREMSASDRLQAISAHMQRSLGLVSVSVWHQQKGRPALLAFAPSQSESESKLIETYGEMVNRLFLPVEEDQQHTENVSLYRVG